MGGCHSRRAKRRFLRYRCERNTILCGAKNHVSDSWKRRIITTLFFGLSPLPGHGGFDPGKVGVNKSLEKDINLAISKKLSDILASSGYTVYMTRTEDVALCQGDEKSKKLTDMKNRVAMIEEKAPNLVVSIHQNSFSAGTKGAQVFYHTKSEEGKRLAGILQQTIREAVGDDNHRVEKANDSYYMLRKVSCPLVIVECGFLSNPEEEAMLQDEEYQKKMALGIAEGVENYLYK